MIKLSEKTVNIIRCLGGNVVEIDGVTDGMYY